MLPRCLFSRKNCLHFLAQAVHDFEVDVDCFCQKITDAYRATGGVRRETGDAKTSAGLGLFCGHWFRQVGRRAECTPAQRSDHDRGVRRIENNVHANADGLAVVELRPGFAVVRGGEHAEVGGHIQIVRHKRVDRKAVHGYVGQVTLDALPGFPKIGGAVNVRRVRVDAVAGGIDRSRLNEARFQVGDAPAGRVGGQRPIVATVGAVVKTPVVAQPSCGVTMCRVGLAEGHLGDVGGIGQALPPFSDL